MSQRLSKASAAQAENELPPAEPAEALPLLEWMRRYRHELKSGVLFDLAEHPYLEGIYADDWPACVYMKAGQMGISEYLISWATYLADQHNANGIYVFPTDKHVSDFSTARLGPAIDPLVSPYLASRVVSSAGGKRGADRVGLKRIGNAFVYFRGGKVDTKGQAPQLKSIDADFLVRDEVDEMDSRVKTISERRLEHSKIAAWRAASTPTYAERGIHAEYLASDKRVWMVQCSSCKTRQPLELGTRQTPGNLVLEFDTLDRPTRWYEKDGKPYLGCIKCGKQLKRASKGEWVAEYPGRPVHGYLVPGLASVRKSLMGLITGLQSTDETERKETMNQGLGLTHSPSGSERLTDTALNACRRDYALGRVDLEMTCAGIDVGSVLNVVIRGRLPDGNRALRHAGQYDSFDEVGRLLKQFNCRTVVIDALPETRKCRELQRGFARLKVWLAYFAVQEVGTRRESPATWDAKELSVNLDRTRAIDAAFALFHNASIRDDETGEPLAGNTLPAGAKDIPDYYAQVLAPERVLERDSRGNQIAVYREGTKKDHYALAETYCAMAFICPYVGWARGAG